MVRTSTIIQGAHVGKRNKTFVDQLRIYARGGPGGQGQPRYGGLGGRGGHVYVIAKKMATLKSLSEKYPDKRFIAGRGENSKVRSLFGKPGKDCEIEAPLGIVLKNDMGRNLGELDKPGDRVLVAKGGPGGGPDNAFLGRKGQAVNVKLDLKLLADIGLVGFPNAGKSTLLSAVSRAHPKIASYPFTTIQPQLGMMMYEDKRQIAIADLPGLIEGAHINIGMGHNFLKHLERTKLLMFVVDLHGFRLSPRHATRSAFQTILLLNKELELYKADLLTKPALLALNKIDSNDSEIIKDEILTKLKNVQNHIHEVEDSLRPKKLIQFDDVIPISAKERTNTEKLKFRLRELLDFYGDLQSESDSTESALAEVKNQLTEHSKSFLV